MCLALSPSDLVVDLGTFADHRRLGPVLTLSPDCCRCFGTAQVDAHLAHRRHGTIMWLIWNEVLVIRGQ
jgi:hypothetical protein